MDWEDVRFWHNGKDTDRPNTTGKERLYGLPHVRPPESGRPPHLSVTVASRSHAGASNPRASSPSRLFPSPSSRARIEYACSIRHRVVAEPTAAKPSGLRELAFSLTVLLACGGCVGGEVRSEASKAETCPKSGATAGRLRGILRGGRRDGCVGAALVFAVRWRRCREGSSSASSRSASWAATGS